MKFAGTLSVFGFSLFVAFAQDESTPPVAPVPSAVDPVPAETSHPPAVEIPHAVRQPIALRVVGSNVKNLIGDYLGRVENVVIDGEGGRAEYAVLLVNYPTNSTQYTPVPWGKLSYVWDQSQISGAPGALQVFLLNMDKATLQRAPSMDRAQFSLIRQPEFARRLAAFYGVTDTAAVGTPGVADGTVVGSGSGGPVTTEPGVASVVPRGGASVPSAVDTTFPFLVSPGIVAVVDTNFVGTNMVINTNIVVTNVLNGITTNVVINLTNFPPTGTNFVGGTNLFPGGRDLFQGQTNSVAGSTMDIIDRLRSGRLPCGTNVPVVPRAGSTAAGAPTGRTPEWRLVNA
jgi:hypothetical protein